MSFFRYAGGKSKLREPILTKLGAICTPNCQQYREPFFGGGSVGLNFLPSHGNWLFARNMSRVWINDKDIGIAHLWTSVIKFPRKLCEKVEQFTPSVQAFYDIKQELLEYSRTHTGNTLYDFYEADERILDIGFKKLVLHQISYSGLGTKSGGPLGGAEQKSKYGIGCRWSPSHICKRIEAIHVAFKRFSVRQDKCTSVDFQELIENTDFLACIYLDPPYFVKGNVLYQEGFTLEDHKRLATALQSTKHCWLLSYDDCPEVRELYKWASIESIDVNYSIAGNKKDGKTIARTKPELLIWRK